MKKLFSLFLFLNIFSSTAFASNVEDLIKQGIKFHDEGKYNEAAEKYKSALKINPNSVLALYELSFTYMLSKNNEECINIAQKGQAIDSNLKHKFAVPLGSCYSQLGKAKQAISAFKEGLKTTPNDPYLHLNIAVTLSNLGEDKKAISHLKKAIKHSNGYSSPYYFIAEIFRTTNYRIPAIYFFMEFILFEPDTRRSHDAAKKIYALLYQGVTVKDDGDTNIVINTDAPKDEGDFSSLELALSTTAAASEIGEHILNKTDIKNSDIYLKGHINALEGFLQICAELDDKNLGATFTWQYAAKDMIKLQKSSDFKAYAYLLAATAGIPGAKEWINTNQDQIEKMSAAIKAL